MWGTLSAAGVSPDPAKIEAVTCWKINTDLKSLRSFIGFCGFYHQFIKNYSALVKPLTEVTKGYPPMSGQNRKTVDGKKNDKESKLFVERYSSFP